MTYGGYEALDKDESLNFGDLTGKLAAAVGGIGVRRQVKRDALDKSAEDLKAVINSWETTKNKDFNKVAIDGANAGRAKIVQWNKDLKAGIISESQYKENLNNLQGGWSSLANSGKTYDATIQEMMARQQPGPNGEPPVAGAVEAAFLESYAEYSDLSNKKFVVGDDGTWGIGSLDENGKVTSFRDSRSLNLPGNLIANSVNLVDASKKSTENVKLWIQNQTNKDGTKMTVEDARSNPAYQKYLSDQADAIAGDHDPKAQVSILTDNGGGHFIFRSEKALQERIDSETKSENEARVAAGQAPMTEAEINKYKTEVKSKGILMTTSSSGEYVFQLSQEQKKLAKDIAKTVIEVDLGRKETNVEETTLSKEEAKKAGKYAPRSGGGSGTTKTPTYATYVSLKDAWDTGDTNELNNMDPDHTYVKDNKNNTIKVYKNVKDSNGKTVPEGMPVKVNGKMTPDKPFSVAKKAREIADFFYREGTRAEAQEKYDREQELWQNEFGDPSLYYSDGTPKKKPKATTPTTPKKKPKFNGK
jgi:hypothetical protein